jgi:hypothetical protein
MTFNCRYCGTPLETDPSITSATGKRIPFSAGKPHDCHLSPYFRSKSGRVKARAATMEALSKIDEFAKKEGVA